MLNVSHNDFTGIPQPIANSSSLLYLVMSGNKISTITPNAFIGLSRLRELDLSFNRLTVFPESIKSLSSLKKLNLAGNRILTVPDAGFSLWPYLDVFQFHGNPLVCSCSMAWLRNYNLTTDLGRCSYPAGLEGNSVTCLTNPSCGAKENMYSSKENIQACFRKGQVLTNQNTNLKWDLSVGNVKTTTKSHANIEVFRECNLVSNVSLVGLNTWTLSDDSEEIGDLVCLTLSDNTWISDIRECVVLDHVVTKDETRSQTLQSVYIGVIVAISILLVIAICTALVIFFICKRRQTVPKQRGTVPTISEQENVVYENNAEAETSYIRNRVNRDEDRHYYDTVKPSDIYENDETNAIPSFPQYNGILNNLRFYGEWMMRTLDKNSFTDLPSVNRLILTNIGLQHLSCDVFNNISQELTIINLDDNQLDHFPACSVNNLYHLRELTLSKNFITCIPGHSVPSFLQHLDVSFNQIYSLSSAMSADAYNKNPLKTFNIRGNKLPGINGDELHLFSNLENLDVSENRLKYIHPKSFVTADVHLLVINLSQNQLTGDVWLSLEHLHQVRHLNLSHNQIDHVSDNVVASMGNLETFDISYNMVSEIGPAFVHQQTVKTLSFHHNLITKVSETMFAAGTGFMHSFDLDLSFNLLVSLDLTIHDCLYCTFSIHHNKLNAMRLSSNQNSTFSLIDISFNVLDAIPSHLPPWINFNGSHNPFSTASVMDFLTDLPNLAIRDVILKNTTFMCEQTTISDIWFFSKIILNLADNCVSSEFLCHLRSNVSNPYRGGVSIYLDRNGIEVLQECSFNVTVSMLSLKGNRLSFMNESFISEEMPYLEYLDLAENNIGLFNVVETLARNSELSHLNTSLNNQSELPLLRYTFKSTLAIFDFSWSNISRAYGFAFSFDYVFYYSRSGEVIVDISNNNLKQNIHVKFEIEILMPTFYLISSDNHIESIEDVIEFGGTTIPDATLVFDFSRNNIKRISNFLHFDPNTHFSYTRIVLNITKNLLTEFPTCDSLKHFKCCVRLDWDFSHNFLQALPHNETCILNKVRMLNVSHNDLTEILKPIANSSSLLYLVMSGNKISTITPSAFIGLSHLWELDLSFNRLSLFPESIKSLSSLKKLNLAGNGIMTVPDAGFSLWPFLTVFQFHGNPLVCSCSMAWLRNYNLTTDLGRCSYPAELEGNSVTCLTNSSCGANENMYSSKENIQACFRKGLVLTKQNENLKWDLSVGNVKTTSKSYSHIEVFRECNLVSNVSLVGLNTWSLSDDSEETGDLVCLTLSDNTWISDIRECVVLDGVVTKDENRCEMLHSVYIGVIVALSILLAIAICTALVIYFRCKGRQNIVYIRK
ncbi:slit homolog 3 protein-like [Pecten maximus]|uniref:slit homolog 3 protein-like n=1 Tax=Pecten maximus TaxID=6579 RepID=UPI0014586826|nr:slit homolog 3 protein-like [Pecten maximus]